MPHPPRGERWFPYVCLARLRLRETVFALATRGALVVWLAAKLAQYGRSLKAGEIIMSGSFTRQFPIHPGDTIRAETKVAALRESKSRPTQGIVTFEHRGFNQRDEVIATCRRVALMLRRPA